MTSGLRRLPAILAIVELACFFVIERGLRKGREAATLDRGAADRGSTMAIGITFGLAMAGPVLTSRTGRGRLPLMLAWAGIPLMAFAIAIRAWAARTLGESYTRTLRVRTGQQLITSGPYALVRHPGYAADIIMWLGYGLAWGSVASLLVTTVPTSIAYAYRISVEEEMLRARFGSEFEDYAARTKRLVPSIY